MAKDQGDQARAAKRVLAEQKQRSQAALYQNSTLPMDLFQVEDPTVEAALANSTVRFFLRHMSKVQSNLPEVELADLPQREIIRQDQAEECARELARHPIQAAPDLLEGLAEERMWILADLAQTGNGSTPLHATKELHQFLTQVWNGEVEAPSLQDLVQALKATDPQGDVTLLCKVLHLGMSMRAEGKTEGKAEVKP